MSSRSKGRRGDGRLVEVEIEALGDRGDGLARHGRERLSVPGALPGERHRVRLGERRGDVRGTVSVACLDAVARATPVCPHAERCGGCATQHVPAAQEAAWRLARVRRALARRGLDAEVVLAHRSPLASRRRLRLVVERHRGGVRLGYRERASRRVVDVEVCPIARPELVAAFASLRRLVDGLEAVPAEIAVTAFPQGLEVVLLGGAAPGLADRERLAAWAEAADVARLALAAGKEGPIEPVAERRAPRLAWAGLAVSPPPGAFLQATAEAEAFLQDAVAGAVAGAGRVLDLFAGVGTLAAAARRAGARVTAVEQDAAAAAALAAGDPPIPVEVRDLERRPPTPAECGRYDAVVLDPPRRGAEPVARALAASGVSRIVHVACAPVTFARDAAILTGGGYRLDRVDVVDQFRFSPAVELVATFSRGGGATFSRGGGEREPESP